MAGEYRNPTEIEVNHIISADVVQSSNKVLLVGDLLKTMDITACLTAEKHAKLPCVTLLMDDLTMNDSLLQGQIVNVKAKITRAFGSSMEVVVDVHLRDMFQQHDVQVCQAYFVFVAIAETGKAKLNHLDPVTVEERLEYALAYERRKLRYKARNDAKAKSSSKQSNNSIVSTTLSPGDLTMNDTAVESTELVLPSQANHNKTTFGGQIMAWLVSTCTIAASKLCKRKPTIIEVNGVHFLKKSTVGDRLFFKAMVNKTFDDKTFEVGCRVESMSLKGETAHINSAYITFTFLDDNDQRQQLPVVKATTVEQVKRQANAVDRRTAQEEKEKILGKIGPAMSVLWTEKLSDVLAFHNVTTFKRLYHLNYSEISSGSDCKVSSCKQDEITCIKVEASIKKPAADVFKAVQLEARASWDAVIIQSKLERKIDEDDSLYHVILAADSDAATSGKQGDAVVMESTRPAVDKDGHVVAYRSVVLPSYPVTDQYERKENMSSGFMICQSDDDANQSTLSYIFQVTNDRASVMLKDLQGTTKVFSQRIQKLCAYLKL